jgi:hypothetical protein
MGSSDIRSLRARCDESIHLEHLRSTADFHRVAWILQAPHRAVTSDEASMSLPRSQPRPCPSGEWRGPASVLIGKVSRS